jgi:hypothetical protein
MSQGEVGAATPSLSAARAGQNLGLGIAAGLGAAVGAAVLWAIVTVATEMELGIAAVAVGYVVGQAVRAAGKGVDPAFSVAGAALALFGCVLGNLLSALAFYAKSQSLDAAAVMAQLSPAFVERLMTAFFQPMDILFYAIAVYEGFKFARQYRVRKS